MIGGRDLSRTVLAQATQLPWAVSPQRMCGQGSLPAK